MASMFDDGYDLGTSSLTELEMLKEKIESFQILLGRLQIRIVCLEDVVNLLTEEIEEKRRK